jgi:hypothetical protein
VIASISWVAKARNFSPFGRVAAIHAEIPDSHRVMHGSMTGAMRQVFAQQPAEFDPRKALVAAKNAARGIVKARFEAFGCAGPASRIKPMPLEAMARRYG